MGMFMYKSGRPLYDKPEVQACACAKSASLKLQT